MLLLDLKKSVGGVKSGRAGGRRERFLQWNAMCRWPTGNRTVWAGTWVLDLVKTPSFGERQVGHQTKYLIDNDYIWVGGCRISLILA